MNSEEKFKELLKGKLEGKEFPFNLANWEKAQEMIDTSRSKKRRIIPFIFLCIGIFISGGLCFYVIDRTISQPPTNLAVNSVPTEAKQALIENKNSPASENVVENEKVQPAEKTAEKIIHHNPAPGEADHSKINAEKPKEINQEPKVIEVRPMRANVAMVRAKAKSRTGDKEVVANNNAAQFATSVTRVKKENESPAEQKVAESKIADAGPVEKPAQIVGSTQPAAANSDVAGSTETLVSVPEPILKVPEPVANVPEAVTILPEPVTIVPVPAGTIAVEPIVTTDVTTTAEKNKEEGADTVIRKRSSFPKNIFSIEAGANYHMAWKAGSDKDANGINPIIGANYLRIVAKKINISLGAHYTTVGNLSNYSHTSKDVLYSFGETGTYTVITPVKVHYLVAPLKLHYVLDEKNVVGVGYTFGYMLTVNNKVENYTKRLNETSDPVVTKTKGYSQGFNEFDSQLSVFYRRRLFNDLSANSEFFFGLTDVKDNSFFASDYFDRNMGIKITLIYNIFKQ